MLCIFTENSYCFIEIEKTRVEAGKPVRSLWQYQVRDDGGMDQGGDSGGGDDWLSSGYILQRERFADGGCVRKGRVRMRPRDLAQVTRTVESP